MQEIAPLFKRPGPQPVCSDSELLTMALVGECRGWDEETIMLSHWHGHADLFPKIPSQSRFNRRRRNLMYAFKSYPAGCVAGARCCGAARVRH